MTTSITPVSQPHVESQPKPAAKPAQAPKPSEAQPASSVQDGNPDKYSKSESGGQPRLIAGEKPSVKQLSFRV
jgi:hypothetical protein